jgi:hypothetical protein
VLRVSKQAGDPVMANLSIALDPGTVKGHTIRVSVMAQCPAGYVPVSQPAEYWWKPRLNLRTVGVSDNRFVGPNERGWRQLVLSRRIPDAATSVEVFIGLPGVNGEAFFDDLVVELDPDIMSAPPKPAGATGSVDDPARWAKAMNVLALVDPAKDAAAGKWELRNGTLAGETGRPVAIRIPYRPPEEYDCRVEFSSDRPDPDSPPATLGVILAAQGHDVNWALFRGKAGLELVDGRDLLSNPTARDTGNWPKPKERGTVMIQVRRTGLKTWLDGRLFHEFPTDYSNLRSHAQWNLQGAGVLGLGVLGGAVFHKVEVLEVAGKGTFTRPDDPAAKEAKKKQD